MAGAQPNHEIVPKSAQSSADRIVWNSVVEGSVDNIGLEYASMRVGDTAAIDASDPWNSGEDIQTPIRLSGISPSRKVGGMLEVSLQWTAFLMREFWNIEWQEVQKDIRTLLVPPNATQQQILAASIDIAHIANWEAQRDNQNWDMYQSFKYEDNGTEVALDGDALVVAQKILKGVQTYTLYVPVVTCTTTWADGKPVRLGTLNQYVTSLPTHTGWSAFGQDPSDFTEMSKWLKQIDRTSNNPDGSVTLVEGWVGLDDLDPDLYTQQATPQQQGGGGS